MKQLPILAWKVYPYVDKSLCSLGVPSSFGGRAGSEVSMGPIFRQGVLATTILIGCGAGVEGA